MVECYRFNHLSTTKKPAKTGFFVGIMQTLFDYSALEIASTLSFASPNNICVLSLKNNGFCTPA